MDDVVLASSSPRRRELLAGLGVAPRIVAPDVDETVLDGERGPALVARLARAKVRAVGPRPGCLVLAADTIVDAGGEILGKPADDDEARRMLRTLSGTTHRVHTAVAGALDDRADEVLVTTSVRVAVLDDATIDWYIATGEHRDKAGAYAIQGHAAVFVAAIEGSHTNVIGLPLHETVMLARGLGVELLGR